MNSWRVITGAHGTSASRRMLSHWSRGRVRMIGSMMSLSGCQCSPAIPHGAFSKRGSPTRSGRSIAMRELAPEGRVAACGEQVLAVGGLEQTINRNRAERILRAVIEGRHFFVTQNSAGVERESAGQNRDFDRLPCPVRTAREDRCDRRCRRHHARRITRSRKNQRDRIAAARPLTAGDSTARRDEVVVGVEVGVGAAAAERRHAERNRARIYAVNRFGVESKLLQPRRCEAGDDDISPSNQLRDARLRCAIVEVQLERALGAVEDVEVRRAAIARTARWLDFDCTRAVFRQQHRGVSCAEVRVEFNDVDRVECFTHLNKLPRAVLGIELSSRAAKKSKRSRQRVIMHGNPGPRGRIQPADTPGSSAVNVECIASARRTSDR